ncbi:MAG: cobalt-zinc-cadmium resistance protein CzcB, partial [Actinomycetota bacterium]
MLVVKVQLRPQHIFYHQKTQWHYRLFQEKLWQQKISPEQDYLIAKNKLAEAQITVTEAQSLLNALGAESTGGTRLTIRAPINGVLMESKLAIGQAVNVDGV